MRTASFSRRALDAGGVQRKPGARYKLSYEQRLNLVRLNLTTEMSAARSSRMRLRRCLRSGGGFVYGPLRRRKKGMQGSEWRLPMQCACGRRRRSAAQTKRLQEKGGSVVGPLCSALSPAVGSVAPVGLGCVQDGAGHHSQVRTAGMAWRRRLLRWQLFRVAGRCSSHGAGAILSGVGR